mmetsp:Transcript_4419/g.9578  ORF Transcript_4419/g.9578 Transcript_4419/m.9578 type:complete len:202 (-) Transcript_4419:1519-2124(-)
MQSGVDDFPMGQRRYNGTKRASPHLQAPPLAPSEQQQQAECINKYRVVGHVVRAWASHAARRWQKRHSAESGCAALVPIACCQRARRRRLHTPQRPSARIEAGATRRRAASSLPSASAPRRPHHQSCRRCQPRQRCQLQPRLATAACRVGTRHERSSSRPPRRASRSASRSAPWPRRKQQRRARSAGGRSRNGRPRACQTS